MKPYYKRGGFFDRLERLSDWIDNQIYRPFGLKRIAEEMDDCIYWINRLSNSMSKYLFNREEARIEVRALNLELAEFKLLYNREKYWWMRAK